MKRNLLLTLIVGLTFMASSCRKFIVTTGAAPLTGRWYLQSAERYDGYKWQPVNTGYESGTFIFYANGDLDYTDALGNLHGNWNMYTANDGYYDSYGNYHDGYRKVFSLQLYNGGGHIPEIDWLFDNSDYTGAGVFNATYMSNGYHYEYTFVRE
jgi:hypothetical protein